LACLQYRLWFESGGIIDMLKAKKQLSVEVSINNQLKKRNEKLIRQVQYMQTHKDAIEPRARAELGMIKKGETFYQIIK
jgi:cell division protein FtsB